MKLFISLLVFTFSVTCYSQSFISKQDAEADIDQFNKTLLEVHADPFLFISRQNYFSQVQKLKQEIKDSIELKTFVLNLYKLTALLKDGHCAPYIVQPAFRPDFAKPVFFPYHLVINRNELYVPKTTAQASGIPAGATVLSINGETSASLLKKLQNTIGGNAAYSNEIEEKFLSYLLYLCKITAPFTIRYKDGNGKISEKQIIEGLGFVDALAVTMPHIKTEYRFKIIDNKLGYVDFMSMSGDINAFDRYMDSCITFLKTKGIQYLAIDLRKNSGGNSVMGEILLSYFSTKNYTLMGGRNWKISPSYKQYLLSNGDSSSSYLQQRDGTIWQVGSCDPKPSRFKNDNVFTGKVYLLTGPFTFSSANMLADGAKQFKLAEIVGEPTGEDTNDFGEAYTFSLPKSKIKMQTTTSFDFGASCNKKVHSPVMPDRLVVRTLADRINEKDAALDYLLKNVK